MMEHRGYTAGAIGFDPESKSFSGTVAGLRAVIHFEGSTAEELIQAFRDSVDVYIDWCDQRGKPPERPFKGQILLRTAPDLHRKAALRAAEEGVSLNEWISRRIAEAA